MKPYYQDKHCTIYHGDCREILPLLEPVDLVVTDPPYPNGAAHFDEGIAAAIYFCRSLRSWAPEALIFWDELSPPYVNLPLVAVHVWHRTNTNRPDNYEAVFHFAEDGKKRASRVCPAAVIAKGLTGCLEATGHPTQKNLKAMTALIARARKGETTLDPFMGSGTTLRAAKDLGRKAIGIELEEKYCEIAAKRLRQEVLNFGEVA